MLLDTSGLLCLHHRDEPLHDDAGLLIDEATVKLTHSYVLAEFVALAHARRLPRQTSLLFIEGVIQNPEIAVVWVDEDLHRKALSLLQARLDKTYSLCDAVSFLLMKSYAITDALTTDRHFEQEGFARLLKP
ncbi:MAG TPA: PIN domain-containing protein [Blastocatellia bacterium]|nr:PIN domain-containing protein [Blastocatellia bacterium]